MRTLSKNKVSRKIVRGKKEVKMERCEKLDHDWAYENGTWCCKVRICAVCKREERRDIYSEHTSVIRTDWYLPLSSLSFYKQRRNRTRK